MGYPKFKKRGDGDSFRLTGSTYVGNNFVHIPGIGKVKLYEKGRVPIPGGQEEVDLPQDEHLRTVSLTGIACGTGESDTVVQVPKAPVHRDRRLQFFQERCLSLKQEFTSYLESKLCA